MFGEGGDDIKGTVDGGLLNTMVFEVHETPILPLISKCHIPFEGRKSSTTHASLTCFASAAMSGLLKSIIGIDISKKHVRQGKPHKGVK